MEMQNLFIDALVVWIIFVFLAIFNGEIRNKLYLQRLGELRAHQLSSVIFIAVIFAVTYAFLNFLSISYSPKDLLVLGLMWLLMTVIFEFLFGHYVIGHPWATLLADYNILEGRIWLLVLGAVAIAPLLVDRIMVSLRSRLF